jgi:hypothetical protein
MDRNFVPAGTCFPSIARRLWEYRWGLPCNLLSFPGRSRSLHVLGSIIFTADGSGLAGSMGSISRAISDY